MSTAESIFASMGVEEPHIVIRDDRVIVVPDELKRIAVQFDNNIETVTFDCPRYWDGHDMSTMTVYINYMRADGKPGSYKAENVRVDETDENIMHFDWTVTRNVSEVKGQLAILVCVRSVDDEGNEQNHWNSEMCKNMYVSEGLDCGESVVEQYPDVITQILTKLDMANGIPTLNEETNIGELPPGVYLFTNTIVDDETYMIYPVGTGVLIISESVEQTVAEGRIIKPFMYMTAIPRFSPPRDELPCGKRYAVGCAERVFNGQKYIWKVHEDYEFLTTEHTANAINGESTNVEYPTAKMVYDFVIGLSKQNVNPIAKTEDMTQPVGVDKNGQLYTIPGGGSDYTLPIGGDKLGGVKNGGNVIINEDGTMTAPESTDESVELDTTLTKEGKAADAKSVGDALAKVGQPTDEQISNAVSGWLDEHPDATTTVQDGSITPVKTNFMVENQNIIASLNDVKGIKTCVNANKTYNYHVYMGNKGFSLNVEGLSKIVVKAFASYINWIQTETEVTAAKVPVISNGYTTTTPSQYGATADTDTPEMREVEIDIADGAKYILIDFGVTKPTYAVVGIPNGTYRFGETVSTPDKINRPKDENGDFIDGAEGQVLYANGENPYWGDKINAGDVSAKATTFWGSDALNIKTECEELPRIEIPWTYAYIQKADSAGKTFYYHCAKISEPGYAIHLKAGVEYVLLCKNQQIRYWTVDPRTIKLNDLTETQAENLEYNNYDSTKYKMPAVAINSLGLYQTYGGKITSETDVYMCVDDFGVLGSYTVFEAEKVEHLKDLSGINIYHRTTEKDVVYKEPFTFNTEQHLNDGRAYYNKYVINEKMRRLIRQTDYLDSLALSNFRLCFIGDSITYAASNAGLQRAFRKMVPYKLQVTTTDTAISGTCMTNGYGFKWGCGVQGVDGLLTDATYIQNVPADPIKRPQIFMIALGTNDFGNNAPLGDVEAEDRDTTFAGCYLKLVETIRANYPKAGIILMCPFNRENGAEPNINGDILLDYCRVIHEIASFTPHTWVLDLSNHPLINFAGYQEGYVDYVHINKYAHAVVSNELYRLIMEIVAVSGFDYLPCFGNLNVGL